MHGGRPKPYGGRYEPAEHHDEQRTRVFRPARSAGRTLASETPDAT